MVNKFILSLFIFFSVFDLAAKDPNEISFQSKLNVLKKQYHKEINFVKAISYFQKKQWDSTLIYSMKQIHQKGVPLEVKDYCHYFRGGALNRLKLFQQALDEFLLVSNDFEFTYKVKIQLAGNHLELGNHKETLRYFKEVEDNYLDKLNYNLQVTLFNNTGLCYLRMQDFKNAEKYLKISQSIVQTKKDTNNLLYSYESLANLYYDQNKIEQAISYIKKGYALSMVQNNINFKKMAASNMAEIEEERNNYKEALRYRKEYEKWTDSINDQNEIWSTADYEKKYEINLQKQKVELLKNENKVKVAERNTYIATSVLFFIILLFGIFFYIQKTKSNKKTLQQKKELDELNATKDRLFSIVSHDLRSSVNALKGSNSKLISSLETKNYEKLDELLHNNVSISNATYNLLDNLLNWSLLQIKQLYFDQESLNLRTIVQHVVFNFKPLLFEKNLNLSVDIPSEINIIADLDSFKICLRNIIDNAIKFSNDIGFIRIYVSKTDEKFHYLVIEDNGVGIDKELQLELVQDTQLLSKRGNKESIGTGLGLQLTKSMMSKNGGMFLIESTLGVGTKMILVFQKATKNE